MTQRCISEVLRRNREQEQPDQRKRSAISRSWGITCCHAQYESSGGTLCLCKTICYNIALGTMTFLDQYDVEVIKWSAMSPDINPTDHVWDPMSIWIRHWDCHLSNLVELHHAVHQAWRVVRRRKVRTLVDNVPHCVRWISLQTGDTCAISNSIESVIT